MNKIHSLQIQFIEFIFSLHLSHSLLWYQSHRALSSFHHYAQLDLFSQSLSFFSSLNLLLHFQMMIITPESSEAFMNNNMSNSPQSETSSNPFFLHHADNLGSVIVSSALDGDNFVTWRRSMMMALVAKNKFGFVDGSIVKPPAGDPSLHGWVRCNNMLLSWMLNSVSKDVPTASSSLIMLLVCGRIPMKDILKAMARGSFNSKSLSHVSHKEQIL